MTKLNLENLLEAFEWDFEVKKSVNCNDLFWIRDLPVLEIKNSSEDVLFIVEDVVTWLM